MHVSPMRSIGWLTALGALAVGCGGGKGGMANVSAGDADNPRGMGTEAGPGGDGGGAGTSGIDGGSDSLSEPPQYTPSAELARLLDEFDKLKRGQPADLDGDGTPEALRTVSAGGSIRVES